MLLNAEMYMYRDPLLAVYAGLLILLVVLTLNFLGDSVREWLDPDMTHAWSCTVPGLASPLLMESHLRGLLAYGR